MASPTDQATFIVRLWAEEYPLEPTAWRGVAERIGAEGSFPFATRGELVDWMGRELQLAQEPSPAARPVPD